MNHEISVAVCTVCYIIKSHRDLAQRLNLPIGHIYHTGIRKDEDQVWRRSSDGAEVKLEGWVFPSSDGEVFPRSHFLYWYLFNDSSKNRIWNSYDRSRYFICEY